MEHTLDVLRFGAAAAVSALVRRRVLNCLWELTYRCNARCAICAYWRSPSQPADELRVPEIAEGLRRLYQYGCRLVNFTGGEPTLRRDLEQIVESASRLGMWTSMVTNGSLLTRERLRALKAAGLDHLLISLDSTDASIHDEHRQIPGCHAKALECLHWLSEDFLTGHRTGGIMCAISALNAHQVLDLVQLAARRGVYAVVQPYHDRKTGDGMLKPAIPEHVLDGIVRAGNGRVVLLNSSRYLRGLAAFVRGEKPGRCAAGRKYFSVDPYGGLHPCVDMPRVGHVLTSDLSVLRSREALASVDACHGCWYCFRGEADSAMTLAGCVERARLAAGIVAGNLLRRSRLRRRAALPCTLAPDQERRRQRDAGHPDNRKRIAGENALCP